MNLYTKLIIDGVEMDLYDVTKLPLSITKRINNLDGDVQGDFSRASITLPATKNNINKLGHSRRFLPFRIEVDGSPSFSGTAQIRKGKTQSIGYAAIEENYQINLISNNSSWFVVLGDTLLSDLTDIIIPWNDTYVDAGWTAPNGTNDWCFPLIKWKEWLTFSVDHYKIKYEEATPALLIAPLIRAAFNSIGYTIDSVFFDTDFFKKLIIPTPIPDKLSAAFSKEYLNTSVSFSSPITLSTGFFPALPFDQIDVFAPANPTAYDNVVTFLYTCPMAGYYEVNLSLKFNTTAPANPYSFFARLTQNGVAPLPPIGFAFDSGGVPFFYPTNGIPWTATGVLFCQAGDTIAFEYAVGVGSSIVVDAGFMTITGEAVRTYGMTLDFKYLLNDWRFMEMLKGVKQIFNLAFETNDVTKVVKIEPKDRYNNRSKYPVVVQETKEGFYQDTTKDYSQLIDYNKEGSFEFEDVEGRFDFTWATDSDETAEWVELVNNIKIYEAKYGMSSGADLSKKRENEVPFFAKTIHVSDVEAKFPDTLITPQFPLIYPQNYVLDPTATVANYDIMPRILYFAGRRFFATDEEGDGYFDLFGIGQSYLPACFMVNYNDNTGIDPSLSFANETVTGVETIGLLQGFHLQDTVRHDQGELRENYVRFNSIDNNNFTFRIKAVIDSQRYILQEIEAFNPLTDNPTNFKFYLDAHPTSANVLNIQNTLIRGVVTLVQ